MEQSKRSSLSVARSILNHKVIGKKLESYLKVRVCLSLSHGAIEHFMDFEPVVRAYFLICV